MPPLRLSVNIDHVATLRQARGTLYPDPVEAAKIAEGAGAHGITCHLRGDRRHVQDDDVRRLRDAVHGKLNLEIAMTEEMLAFAAEVRPHQVTLVPERPDEVTTEGGLDVLRQGEAVRKAADALVDAGIAVSVFLDPDSLQLEALAELGTERIPGVEINTDAFTQRAYDDGEIQKIAHLASIGAEHGFEVYAGHGLTTQNVGRVAAIPEIEELNIGHFLVSRAALVGMATAVEEMLRAMAAGREEKR